MFIKRFLKITAVMFFILSVSGCGGDDNSNTNGTLTLSAVATESGAGSVSMTATAILASALPGKAVVGEKVSFVVTQFGYNPLTSQYETVETFSQQIETDANGAATLTHNFAQSQIMATSLQISAACGGLSKSVSVSVAKYTPVVVP